MNVQKRFRCNDPDVIYEIYDEEVVILNFRDGNYYSLKNTARTVWVLLMDGFSTAEIQKQYTDASDSCSADIRSDIVKFVGSLIKDGLIVDSGERDIKKDSPKKHSDITLEICPQNFTPPVLEKYTEMQELLLLDPIHEVSDTGWPSKKNKSSD